MTHTAGGPGAVPTDGDVSGLRPPGRWSVDHWPDRDFPWRVLRHEDGCDMYVDDYEFPSEAEARAVCAALNGGASPAAPQGLPNRGEILRDWVCPSCGPGWHCVDWHMMGACMGTRQVKP